MVQFRDLVTADSNWPAPKEIHSIIIDLINTTKTPSELARKIHQVIITDTQESYLSYTSVPKPTASQLKDGSIKYPAPRDLLHFLFRCIGVAAMEICPTDKGQEYLVGILEELTKMPKTKLPDATGGELGEVEIYDITPENKYAGFSQWLWELNQNISRPPKRDLQNESNNFVFNAYINYSSFLARLLESGVCEVTNLSALTTGPFALSSKSFNRPVGVVGRSTDPIGVAQEYEPYICAAAQWILFAPRALREMTEKRVRVRPMEKLFSPELWNAWKEKFQAVGSDERFSEEIRGLVKGAVEKMEEQESVVTQDFVVEKLGFVREDDEDDEDDEDEDE